MPRKQLVIRENRTKRIGQKEDLSENNAQKTEKRLHEEYEKAKAILDEMLKKEKPDSKKLLKQEEIVLNLSRYRDL